jgi:hypothetical protein
MGWDRNFVEKTLPNLIRGQQVPLEEDSDPQGFNDRSVEYGKTLSQQKMLEESLYYRSELISQLRKLPNEAFDAKPPVGKSKALSVFLEQMFISHDQHHRKQIETFLSAM